MFIPVKFIEVGDLVIDGLKHKVTFKDSEIILTSKEFKIIEFYG